MSFKAILLNKSKGKNFSSGISDILKKELYQQKGDTLVKLDYSSINYKDALAITNKGPIVAVWPMIPGIEGVGTVVECKTNKHKIGQTVILSAPMVGISHWGCLSQYAYVDSDWLIPLPEQLTPWQAMTIGIAGYTAALCVLAILNHGVKPNDGKVLVTGATGGVGSFAIMLLAKMGYQVTASTGKKNEHAYLTKLGAAEIIDRSALAEAGKPLQSQLWSAAVDTLGSHTLANVCAQIKYGGVVAACGLAQGIEFPATVAPFILRGITLSGIDAVMASDEKRSIAFGILAKHIDFDRLEEVGHTIGLHECIDAAEKIIAGQVTGRFVVDLNTVS